MATLDNNIHTTVFTPRDFQTELLAASFEENTLICLGHRSSKEFIALKLLQEMAGAARKAQKFSIYLTQNNRETSSMYTMLSHLTDLKVQQMLAKDEATDDKAADGLSANDAVLLPPNFQVYVMHPQQLLRLLRSGLMRLQQIYLLIVEDCHVNEMLVQVWPLFEKFLADGSNKPSQFPKILGMGGPLHSCGCPLENLNAMLNSLESSLHCKAETASDIVTVLR